MKDPHQINLQILSLKERHDTLLNRYASIAEIAMSARSDSDNHFMMNSAGWKEMRAIENEISALQWVIEGR